MDKLEKESVLKSSYILCLKELQLAETNIVICTKQIYQTVSFIAKEFENFQAREIHPLTCDKILNDYKYVSNMVCEFNKIDQLLSHDNDEDFLNLDYLIKDVSAEQFTLSKPDLSKYYENCQVVGFITFISNKRDKLFYINDVENPGFIECIKRLNIYKENNPVILNHYPEEGELFGLISRDHMFRAVLGNNQYHKNRKKNDKAYLIDTGEIVDISPDMNFYTLSCECKMLPSQAVPCKLEKIKVNNDLNFEEYLYDHLHSKVKFLVTQKDKSVIYMDVFISNNMFRDDLLQQDNIEVQNHFYSFSDNNNLHKNLLATNQINENLTTYEENAQKNLIQRDQSMNLYSARFFDQEHHTLIYKCNYESIKNELDGIHGFDIEQKNEKIRIQNQLSTSSSLKAVLGYIPRDDKKICRFFDAKVGSCFKGSRCKLEHIEKLSDGWTRDEDETTIDVKNKIVYPLRGNIVKVFPTNVIDSKSFYAKFHDTENHSEIKKLISKMNSNKEKLQFFELDSSPVLLQLVIATHNNDAVWYRARIVEMLDDLTYKVFFLDFGDADIVNIQQIRKWESRYEYLPFQAVKFEIVNIEHNSSTNCGIELLKERILGRILKAEVLDISQDDVIFVQLYDENDYNVGKQLTLMNYVNEKQTKFLCQEQLLPG